MRLLILVINQMRILQKKLIVEICKKVRGKSLKKVFRLFIILLIMDQVLKFYFQFFFFGKRIQWKRWGFTYKRNYGTWLIPDATREIIIILVIGCIISLFFATYLYKFYTNYVRNGKLINFIFALFLAGMSSNIFIDQILFGYIRDYIINPIAISNLADIYLNLMVILIIIESIITSRNVKNKQSYLKENSMKSYFLFIYADIKKS